MKKISFVLLVITCLFSIATSASGKSLPQKPTLQPGDLPIGELGYPIGSYLVIEGKRVDGIKTGVSTLAVSKVNGNELKKVIHIWIDNIDLPKGKKCIIKGYETFKTLGVPPAVIQAAEENNKDVTMPQWGWQVWFYFIATSVVSPKELKIQSG